MSNHPLPSSSARDHEHWPTTPNHGYFWKGDIDVCRCGQFLLCTYGAWSHHSEWRRISPRRKLKLESRARHSNERAFRRGRRDQARWTSSIAEELRKDTCRDLRAASGYTGPDLSTMPEPGVPTMNLLETVGYTGPI